MYRKVTGIKPCYLQTAATVIGILLTLFLFYQAITNEAKYTILFFIGYTGSLFSFSFLVHLIERFNHPSEVLVRLGHFTHSSDYRDTFHERSWKDNYTTSLIRFKRPKFGKELHKVRCHNTSCPLVEVEIWSHARALRNKVIVVCIYTIYGFFWIFLVRMWPELRENAHPFVGLLVTITAFIGAGGILIAIPGLIYIVSPWVGTEKGVGKSIGFLGSTTLKGHKIFSEH